MYNSPTMDPLPYLLSAYLLAAVLIGGYAFWLARSRKKNRKHLDVISGESKGGPSL